MASVVVGFWNVDKFQKFKLDNINLDGTVETLKSQLLAQAGSSIPNNAELTFCGNILVNDNTLSSYGVTSGVTIHIVENKNKSAATNSRKISEAEVQEVVSSFRNFKMSPSLRNTLHRLENPEEIDKIIEMVPGLEEDPVAVSIISKPDILMHMIEPKTVRTIAEKHPVLIEAAKYIVNKFHLESSSAVSGNVQPSTSSGYSYSLEALSDEDDDMDSNSDINMSGHPLSRNSSYNAITAAQLAAAIANVTNSAFGQSNSGGAPGTPNSVITSEMFSNAMQQAFGVSAAGNSGSFSPTTPTRNGEESMANITRRLQPQLQQMREMGLVNDSVNIRALQATNGDVQAAVDLVFNGVID